ncbi:MAG: non-canonical purine NTP pyrophosphatase, partial [Peptococcaceae bacterium]|nr:non-canonical purine NTP pyrophosphatase [Peptococcaceae bacterium]
MQKRLLMATANPGKVRELRQLLAGESIQVFSLKDLAELWQKEDLGGLPRITGSQEEISIEIRHRYEALQGLIRETGETFQENARIKAEGALRYTGLACLADDSGLEVDCLDGAPGVYSARYAGEGGSEEDCNRLLLLNMAGVPLERRTARYRAVLALALPEGRCLEAEGTCEGRIGFAEKGTGGFGYDP